MGGGGRSSALRPGLQSRRPSDRYFRATASSSVDINSWSRLFIALFGFQQNLFNLPVEIGGGSSTAGAINASRARALARSYSALAMAASM
jgi:hypothetical protein